MTTLLANHNADLRPRTWIYLTFILLGLNGYALLIALAWYFSFPGSEFRLIEQVVYINRYLSLPWLVMTPVAIFLARRFPLQHGDWVKPLMIQLITLSLFLLLHLTFLAYHFHYRVAPDRPDMQDFALVHHIGHFILDNNIVLPDLVIYCIVTASINLRHFYRITQQRAVQAAQLGNRLKDAQLQALRMQINPHFLFNTLNAIAVLVQKQENQRAVDMIQRLSRFFRQTLDESDLHWVPLQHELDMINRYLDIEFLRFGDRLSFEHDYDPQSLSVPVPTMILQPLVENALRHGLSEKSGNGTLKILTKRLAERVLIQIEDDGVGCDFLLNNKLLNGKPATGFSAKDKSATGAANATQTTGVGLANVRARLQEIYGSHHSFSIQGQAGKGVRVTLELPCDIPEQPAE